MSRREQKLGLVWRNRKKISQIIKDYFCLPFFLLIILWLAVIKGIEVITKFKKLVRADKAVFLFRMAYYTTINKGLPGSRT